MPFLTHFYRTFPEKLESAGPGLAPDGGEVEEAADSGGGDTASTNAGVADDPEALRSSLVWNSYTLEASTLIEMGPSRGARLEVYRCTIQCGAGGWSECGAKRKVTHVAGKKSHSTSNLVTHIREAAKKGCTYHLEALATIDEANKFKVNVGGCYVNVHNFSEAFPHHVRYMWVVAAGTPGSQSRKPAFREFVRGYEPRACFPHHTTIHRLVECARELQKEK